VVNERRNHDCKSAEAKVGDNDDCQGLVFVLVFNFRSGFIKNQLSQLLPPGAWPRMGYLFQTSQTLAQLSYLSTHVKGYKLQLHLAMAILELFQYFQW